MSPHRKNPCNIDIHIWEIQANALNYMLKITDDGVFLVSSIALPSKSVLKKSNHCIF